MARCRVCERGADEGSVYCPRHLRAYENLESAYAKWRYALGLDWLGYVTRIIKTPGTGIWVVEVAKDILKEA